MTLNPFKNLGVEGGSISISFNNIIPIIPFITPNVPNPRYTFLQLIFIYNLPQDIINY